VYLAGSSGSSSCVLHGGISWHQSQTKFPEWWLAVRKRLIKERRRGFDTFFILVIGSIWLERNAGVFRHESKQVQGLIAAIRDEGELWVGAGYANLSDLLH
jgi:hypothetical protein